MRPLLLLRLSPLSCAARIHSPATPASCSRMPRRPWPLHRRSGHRATTRTSVAGRRSRRRAGELESSTGELESSPGELESGLVYLESGSGDLPLPLLVTSPPLQVSTGPLDRALVGFRASAGAPMTSRISARPSSEWIGAEQGRRKERGKGMYGAHLSCKKKNQTLMCGSSLS